jgi:hypothetical protein
MDWASYDSRSFGDVTSTILGRNNQEWNSNQVSLFNLMMQTFLKEDKNQMMNLVEICYGVVSTMETDLSKWVNIYQVVEKKIKRKSELLYTSVPLTHWT